MMLAKGSRQKKRVRKPARSKQAARPLINAVDCLAALLAMKAEPGRLRNGQLAAMVSYDDLQAILVEHGVAPRSIIAEPRPWFDWWGCDVYRRR